MKTNMIKPEHDRGFIQLVFFQIVVLVGLSGTIIATSFIVKNLYGKVHYLFVREMEQC